MFTLTRFALMLIGAFTVYGWVHGLAGPTPQDLTAASAVVLEAAPQVADRLVPTVSDLGAPGTTTEAGTLAAGATGAAGAAEQAFAVVVRTMTGIGTWLLDQLVSLAEVRATTG
jgi:hypothetical protein